MSVFYIAARAMTINNVLYNPGDTIDTTGWNANVVSEWVRLGWLEPQQVASSAPSMSTVGVFIMLGA